MANEEELGQLKSEIASLKIKIEELENKNNGFQLKYPLDAISKGIVQDAYVAESVNFIETSFTPVAITGKGRLFTASNNLIYFQDGDGTNHQITLTT